LIDLGIKLIDPSIFSAADKRRCSTSQMQHSLFKVSTLRRQPVASRTRPLAAQSAAT
jgi:hypothetical protein